MSGDLTRAERREAGSARPGSRRPVLLALASLLPFALLLRAMAGVRREPRRLLVRGPLPEGLSVSGAAAFWREGDSVAAVSLRCTHLGCTLHRDGEDGLACPCHGSRFDARGRLQSGPARSDLARLRLTRGEGREDVVVELPA